MKTTLTNAKSFKATLQSEGHSSFGIRRNVIHKGDVCLVSVNRRGDKERFQLASGLSAEQQDSSVKHYSKIL